ncbi:MAG: hypothetical protein ACPHRO_15230, partial [Nannocystaceae bacterium]
MNRDPWEMDISLLEDGANEALAQWTRALLEAKAGTQDDLPSMPEEIGTGLAETGPVAMGVWIDGQPVV